MPLREHQEHMASAFLISQQGKDTEYAKLCGINGFPAILKIKTLRVPESFPLDMMHLLYQGAILQVLVPLFAGTFWPEGSPMNQSNRGKSTKQISHARKTTERSRKVWIELDNNGLRIFSDI